MGGAPMSRPYIRNMHLHVCVCDLFAYTYNVIFMVCNIINSKYEKGVEIVLILALRYHIYFYKAATGRHIAQSTLCRFDEIEYIWMKIQRISNGG